MIYIYQFESGHEIYKCELCPMYDKVKGICLPEYKEVFTSISKPSWCPFEIIRDEPCDKCHIYLGNFDMGNGLMKHTHCPDCGYDLRNLKTE
jgi:hypothetical protein